jgi:hypothetical protein
MPNPKDMAYSQAVRAEKERLFGLSDADLLALPEYSATDRTVSGVQVSVGVYHQSHRDGFEVVAAQAKREILFGYGHMFVEGFILHPDGSRDALPERVLWEYA